MLESKNFSVFAKVLHGFCILLCVGATTILIMFHAPKKTPEVAAPEDMSEEIRRGEDILNANQ